MKARQTKLPFIILTAMSIIGVLSVLLIFFRTADFSIFGIAQSLAILITIFFILYLLAMNFRKAQSIELTNEGVWSLVWRRSTQDKNWPHQERVLLKWADMKDWAVRAHLIYLNGSRNKLVINTLLFENPDEVIGLINRSTDASRHDN